MINRNKRLKILQIALIITLIVITIILIPEIKKITVGDISGLMPKSIALAGLIIFGLYCLKSVTIIIPMVLLYVSAGIIFSPFWAIVFTFVCLIAEMTIGFYTGRYLGQNRIMELVVKSKYGNKITGYIQNNSLLSCFIVRIVPGFPTDLMSMVFGATNAKYHQFLAGSILGLMPGMIPIVLLGNSITDPLSKEFFIPFSISAVLSISAIIFYRVWIKKHRTLTRQKTDVCGEKHIH